MICSFMTECGLIWKAAAGPRLPTPPLTRADVESTPTGALGPGASLLGSMTGSPDTIAISSLDMAGNGSVSGILMTLFAVVLSASSIGVGGAKVVRDSDTGFTITTGLDSSIGSSLVRDGAGEDTIVVEADVSAVVAEEEEEESGKRSSLVSSTVQLLSCAAFPLVDAEAAAAAATDAAAALPPPCLPTKSWRCLQWASKASDLT